jgi:uncharacterized protein (TIGR03435 family)
MWSDLQKTSAICGLLFFAALACGQSQSFEVAAITLDKSGLNSSHWHDDRSRMTATNVSLRQLIVFAYQVHDFQISGPDWLRSQHFDIQAEGEHWANREERPAILQNLLVERFKLTSHRETKELPVFALVVAKDGPRLQSVKPNGNSGVSSGRGNMTLEKASMKEIVDSLSLKVDRPVIDKTGLTGAFNGELHWTPDDVQPSPPGAGDSALPDSGPSIFTALQEQFGLKLIARRGPVEVVVIDHVEKLPTEN